MNLHVIEVTTESVSTVCSELELLAVVIALASPLISAGIGMSALATDRLSDSSNLKHATFYLAGSCAAEEHVLGKLQRPTGICRLPVRRL